MKIDPKIKSLVDAIKRVPYITPHSSSQGHFESDKNSPRNEFAHVRFHVKVPYEKEFTNLVHVILSANLDRWSDYRVEIFKRWYMVPDELRLLQYDWMLEIKPHEAITEDRGKRRVTDEAIPIVEKAILQYLESKDLGVL